MNCHRCANLRYDGRPYGHCTHPDHPDVVFIPRKDRKGQGSQSRPYSKEKCPDYRVIRRCSTCVHWERGQYFRDGVTPATKGHCKAGLKGPCQMWEQGFDSRKRKCAT